MNVEGAHFFYSHQAAWTRSTRNYLYRLSGLLRAERILEVGSGTGVLSSELNSRTNGLVFSVDRDLKKLIFAKNANNKVIQINADGLSMPFADGQFDIVFCHYYLIWVTDIEKAVDEMLRVVNKNGYLVVAAEPDYEGIIEYPDKDLAENLLKNLKKQGIASPNAGRKVVHLLNRSTKIEAAGVVSYLYKANDLSLLEKTCSMKLDRKENITFFQPIFYAIAKKHK